MGEDVSEIPHLTVFPTFAWGDRNLLESDLRVLGVICARYNRKTGQCNPSRADIAEHSGYSERTVAEAIVRLKENGYLVWAERWNPATGARLSNEYELLPFGDGSWNPMPDPMQPGVPTPHAAATSRGSAAAPQGPPAGAASHPPGSLGFTTTKKENREVELRREQRNEHGASPMREIDDPEEAIDEAPWIAAGLTWREYAETRNKAVSADA